MNEALTILATHVASTLPDSLEQRKRVLGALRKLLPDRHPAAANVDAQIAALATIEKLQQQLPLKFS